MFDRLVNSVHGLMLTSNSPYGPIPFASTGDAVFPVANRIVLTPIAVPRAVRITRVGATNPATASGNILYGIYDRWGTLLFGSSSVAQTANILQMATCDVQLGRGIYYIAVSLDNTTGRLYRVSPGTTAAQLGVIGMKYVDPGSFTLPASVTMLAAIDQFVPVVGMWEVAPI